MNEESEKRKKKGSGGGARSGEGKNEGREIKGRIEESPPPYTCTRTRAHARMWERKWE